VEKVLRQTAEQGSAKDDPRNEIWGRQELVTDADP